MPDPKNVVENKNDFENSYSPVVSSTPGLSGGWELSLPSLSLPAGDGTGDCSHGGKKTTCASGLVQTLRSASSAAFIRPVHPFSPDIIGPLTTQNASRVFSKVTTHKKAAQNRCRVCWTQIFTVLQP